MLLVYEHCSCVVSIITHTVISDTLDRHAIAFRTFWINCSSSFAIIHCVRLCLLCSILSLAFVRSDVVLVHFTTCLFCIPHIHCVLQRSDMTVAKLFDVHDRRTNILCFNPSSVTFVPTVCPGSWSSVLAWMWVPNRWEWWGVGTFNNVIFAFGCF